MSPPPRGRAAAGAALAGALLLFPAPGSAQAPEAPAQASPPPCKRPLHSAPDGPPLACLEARAPVRVQERVPGWVRVQIEGWLPERSGADLAALPGRSALALTASLSAGIPAAGAVARLLTGADDLDAQMAALRQRHAVARSGLERRLAEVDRALERVLFSSDNLTQAQENRRRLRAERQDLERQISDLRGRSLGEAAALIGRHQSATAIGDASGFILFEEIEPGEYRLLVTAGRPGEGPAWSADVSLRPGERRRIDLGLPPSGDSPLAGFD